MSKCNHLNKIVIMAGGTGGHVYPGLAVADVLKEQNWHIEWFGTADKMEAEAVPKAGYPIHFIDVNGVRGKGVIGKLKMPFMLLKSTLQARALLKALQPNVVLGMGGYASGPGGLAARSLGIPIVVHEQNAVFGLTNRWLAKIAKRVLCGFDVSASSFADSAPHNIEFVGNPVRAAFFEAYQADNTQGVIELPAHTNVMPTSPKTFNILILGGSLGALAINQIVPSILHQLSQTFALNITHQAGRGKHHEVLEAYAAMSNVCVTEFIDNMPQALQKSDLVICRAGALTVAEVASVGRAAIFIPLPIAVDDHQTYNAKSLSEENAGILMLQDQLRIELPKQLYTLLNNPESIITMGKKAKQFSLPNASTLVAQACIEVADTHYD